MRFYLVVLGLLSIGIGYFLAVDHPIPASHLPRLLFFSLVACALWFLNVPMFWGGRIYYLSLSSVLGLTLLATLGPSQSLFCLLGGLLLYLALERIPLRAKIAGLLCNAVAYGIPFLLFWREPGIWRGWAQLPLMILVVACELVLFFFLMTVYDALRTGHRFPQIFRSWFSPDGAAFCLVEVALVPCLAFVLALEVQHGWAWATLFVIPAFLGLRKALFTLQHIHQELHATVGTFEAAMAARDQFTEEHSERVALYARVIAEHYGLPSPDWVRVEKIALLHDIGKVFLDDQILKKAGKLTSEEYEHIKKHTILDDTLLGQIPKNFPLAEWLRIAMMHHERYDGKGYPRGLKGEEIPLEARIIAVADAWDAMTSPRVYREDMPEETALDILKEYSGQQWDPKVIEAFFKAYRSGDIHAARNRVRL